MVIYYRIISSLLLILIILVGCSANSENSLPNKHSNHPPVEFTKISTKGQLPDQQSSNKAKELLGKKEDVIAVQAVNDKKRMLITIEIPHHERFSLAKVRKKLTKEMEDEFPDLEVELSTDQKIILELEDLENKMKDNSISKEKLTKELKHIIKLSKEQT